MECNLGMDFMGDRIRDFMGDLIRDFMGDRK